MVIWNKAFHSNIRRYFMISHDPTSVETGGLSTPVPTVASTFKLLFYVDFLSADRPPTRAITTHKLPYVYPSKHDCGLRGG
jgi:hypothetical protein